MQVKLRGYKEMGERWIFNGQKRRISSCVRGLFIVVWVFFLFYVGMSRFRICALLVSLSQILNFTTGDPRRD